MGQKEPTSDCNTCKSCPEEAKDREGNFPCRATGMITPNMRKWCRHYEHDGSAPREAEKPQEKQAKAPHDKNAERLKIQRKNKRK